MKTETAYRRNIIKEMKSLGTYRQEFDYAAKRCAKLRLEYDTLRQEYESSGYQTGVETAAGGAKTSPIIVRMNQLEQTIPKLEDSLGLSPRAYQSMQTETGAEQDEKLGKLLRQMKEE